MKEEDLAETLSHLERVQDDLDESRWVGAWSRGRSGDLMSCGNRC